MFGIPRADNNFESTKILGRLVANSNLPMSKEVTNNNNKNHKSKQHKNRISNEITKINDNSHVLQA